jgi:hypothetical protein
MFVWLGIQSLATLYGCPMVEVNHDCVANAALVPYLFDHQVIVIKALPLLVDFNRSKQDRGQETPVTKLPANLSFSSLAGIAGVRCGVSDPNGHGRLTC